MSQKEYLWLIRTQCILQHYRIIGSWTKKEKMSISFFSKNPTFSSSFFLLWIIHSGYKYKHIMKCWTTSLVQKKNKKKISMMTNWLLFFFQCNFQNSILIWWLSGLSQSIQVIWKSCKTSSLNIIMSIYMGDLKKKIGIEFFQ